MAKTNTVSILSKTAILLTFCTSCTPTVDVARFQHVHQETNRWYTQIQSEQGEALYATHCAQCHGSNAEGQFVQKDTLIVPPLDTRGHVWRMPVTTYLSILQHGKGRMPSINNLTQEERLLVLAAISQHWSQRKYTLWQKIQNLH